MKPLEPLQGGKRLGSSLQITLADGHHAEDVAVLRNLDGQGLACAQRGTELIALEESSNTQDFHFDGGCDRCCRGCLHCFQKKGGPKPAVDSIASGSPRARVSVATESSWP